MRDWKEGSSNTLLPDVQPTFPPGVAAPAASACPVLARTQRLGPTAYQSHCRVLLFTSAQPTNTRE